MNEGKSRKAACVCGELHVIARGEPDVIVACSCLACQRRTGSVFGVGAYFRRNQILSIEGGSRTFGRTAASGRGLTYHFCPACGTSVYWILDMRPDHIGVAVGCFAEPTFGAPARMVWAENKHHWVDMPEGTPVFDRLAT
ncbi:MAG: GFA family protein [Geminicoccaceae bacterium]